VIKKVPEYVDLLILSGISKIYSGCKNFNNGLRQLERARMLSSKWNLLLKALTQVLS